MKNIQIILSFLLVSITTAAHCQEDNRFLQLDSLSTLLSAEFSNFQKTAKYFGYKVSTMVLDESRHSHAQSDTIFINRTDIYSQVRNSNFYTKKLFADYVLGHEIGHVILAQMYSPDKLARMRSEAILFIESFSDVASGFLTAAKLYFFDVQFVIQKSDSLNKIQENERILASFFGTFQKVAKFSIITELFQTHPNNFNRLLSLQQGVLLGNVVANRALIDNLDSTVFKNNRNTITRTSDRLTKVAKSIGFADSNHHDPFQWIHGEAEQIVNENNSVLQSIIIHSRKEKVDSISAIPKVSFSAEFLNIGVVPVHFFGLIYTQSISIADPSNYAISIPIDGVVFDTILPAGKSVLLSCNLRISIASGFESVIIAPGDRRSLYCGFNNVHQVPDLSKRESILTSFPDSTPQNLEKLRNLILTLIDKRLDLIGSTKGIGMSPERTIEQILNNNIYYGALFSYDDSREETIVSNRQSGKIAYSAHVGEFGDLQSVRNRFETLVRFMSLKFSHYHHSEMVDGSDYRYVIFDKNHEDVFSFKIVDSRLHPNQVTIELEVDGSMSK